MKDVKDSSERYLVLLREAQGVVSFEPLDVVSQVTDSDGRMFPHPCRDKEMKRSAHTPWVNKHTHTDAGNISELIGHSDMR